ncbi:MAG: hypothetical protein J6Z38_00005 [Lachnospiraceae bacterium]|nr:hypothetical protein [Lachnospiraceae bacterium]
MSLENFDQMLKLIPQRKEPLRVVLAGSDGENKLKGLFDAQKAGFAQPVLVGDRAKTITLLEKLGLADEPYTLVETLPGHSIPDVAVDVIRCGDGDILMRGNLLTQAFLIACVSSTHGLRRDRELMSHVSLSSMPEYPKLLGLADMAVIIDPDIARKRAIIINTVTALKALGYEKPVLAMLALVEKGTFQMEDIVEAQSLVFEHRRRPLADCELWGPISYDLIISKEAARLKDYDCPYTGGGFDAIIAPELTTANTLAKSWMIHAHSTVCGAVLGATVPIALNSRSASARESFLSVAFAAILHKYYGEIGWLK